MADLILRGMSIGALALIIIIFASNRHQPGALSAIATGICAICYVLASSPTSVPPFAEQVLVFGATLTPVALSWMATVYLTDDPPQRLPILILAGLTVLTALFVPVWSGFGYVRGALAILLYLGLVVLALVTDQDDLVAHRRLFRRGFLVAMGTLGLTISTVEIAWPQTDLPEWVFPLQAFAILVLVLSFGVWSLDLVRAPSPQTSSRKARPDLARRIDAAMQNGIWQREGLTISEFADELNVPDHQIRATINGEMGFRNFSTFINSARIQAAKQMLADPEQGGTTILQIAHEVGFASLGPFNKAFRAQTGTSPRDFRKNG